MYGGGGSLGPVETLVADHPVNNNSFFEIPTAVAWPTTLFTVYRVFCKTPSLVG